MTSPGAPGASRGTPALDAVAQDVLGQVRGTPRWVPPPDWDPAAGYERAQLTDEERAEAEKAKADAARICRFCIGEHALANTVGCPRIQEATLDRDGHVTSVKFWPGTKWAERVVLLEDLHESEAGDG